ncbi:hypothetical protein PL71_15040 [Pseudoalteromonas distincta]|uniref:RNA-directed DNA polymerase n=1 Tax=Pseudoalteromonas distincta TaxID=77608 RepID=A0ABT9GBV4_9GAMM|nr:MULTISPECIES: reverse transcriptase family protein [Pseudoalteromonas distincta group]KHM46189.1 hypothetical protein PL71_15040 [Pseudoalteromonas elyakovii]KID37016.1 hypothetical protein QT16_13425 [Pseudoalteromonas distincta]MDP4483366.1 reverse transcriptase family protein [Pseudoalteromonas elyakovii]
MGEWVSEGSNKFCYYLNGNKSRLEAKKVILKKGVKSRDIFVPNEEGKKYFKKLIPALDSIFESSKIVDISHGFVKGRGAVSNSKCHLGFNVGIQLDIQDFFPNITVNHLRNFLPERILDVCFIEDRLPQGLPTSPIISNIAMIYVDAKINGMLYNLVAKGEIESYSHTRYADDITISISLSKDRLNVNGFRPGLSSSVLYRKERYELKEIYLSILERIKLNVEEILIQSNLALHPKKTKYDFAYQGNRIITGVSLGKKNIQVSRKVKRKLRAAIHQSNVGSSLGLMAWVSQHKS